MDGRNCTGNRISLLNNSGEVTGPRLASQFQLPPLGTVVQRAHQHPQPLQYHQPSTLPSFTSRASSSTASTPASPKTPQLIRSGSSDSRAFSTPSPLTPLYSSFDHPTQAHHARSQQQYFLQPPSHPAKMDDPALYPPIPHSLAAPSAYQLGPLSTQMPTLVPEQSMSPVSEPSHGSNASTAASTSAKKSVQPKKNQYPCPMAKQIGCTDYFTTSGHAARHAKKHTGKKDAFCPECNKAFTRKDNMEQHRRTHQNGRTPKRADVADDSSKIKKPAAKSQAKRSSIRAEPQRLEAAAAEQLAGSPQAPHAPLSVPLAAQVAQAQQVQAMQLHAAGAPVAVDEALMLPPQSGPYFLGAMDTGPIPALPNPVADMHFRPSLQRSNFASSLDYTAPLMGGVGVDTDGLHFSYPSPGLSNGLNSLALAASEHRRLSEEKARESQSPRLPQESPSEETPVRETP